MKQKALSMDVVIIKKMETDAEMDGKEAESLLGTLNTELQMIDERR